MVLAVKPFNKQSVALVFGLKFPESQGVPLFLNLEYNYLDA